MTCFKFVTLKNSFIMLWTYKIPNSKHQITNKSQISIFNDQNMFGVSNLGHFDFSSIDVLSSRSYTGLGFWILVIVIYLWFVICDLLFVISGKEIPILFFVGLVPRTGYFITSTWLLTFIPISQRNGQFKHRYAKLLDLKMCKSSWQGKGRDQGAGD